MFDVAIIGCGPTGATLANLLAGLGLSVAVLDQEPEIYALPRAVHFDDEVMRVFQTVGIADQLAEQVLVNPGMRFLGAGGQLLLDWPRPTEKTPHGWHASYRLHQPDLEQMLRKALRGYKTVQCYWGCKATGFLHETGFVRIRVSDKNSDPKRDITARYVVGCDGANSLVRSVINSKMDDFGFAERWLVVDLLLKRERPDLGDHSIQFCDPVRPMTYCRSPGRRRRWEISMTKGERDADLLRPDRIWSFLSRWISPDDAEIERCAVYTFRSQVARNWHLGRLVIAGDAAHLTPPFMGQGMCAGIRDAANLAWKLAATLRDPSSDIFLESYGQERRPHVQAYIETAIKLGRLIGRMDEDSAADLASDSGAMRSISPKLGQSPLMQSRPNEPRHPAGRCAEQITTGSGGQRFDDMIGYRHAIISRKPLSRTPKDDVTFLAEDQVGPDPGILGSSGANAIWVRPDRYIGAIADDPDNLPDFLFGE